jgi:hypothetical protein
LQAGEYIEECFKQDSNLFLKTTKDRLIIWNLQFKNTTKCYLDWFSLKEIFDSSSIKLSILACFTSKTHLIFKNFDKIEEISVDLDFQKFDHFCVCHRYFCFLTNDKLEFVCKESGDVKHAITVPFASSGIMARNDVVVVVGYNEIMVVTVKNDSISIVHEKFERKIHGFGLTDDFFHFYIICGNRRDGINLIHLEPNAPKLCQNIALHSHFQKAKIIRQTQDTIVLHFEFGIYQFSRAGYTN